MSSEYKPNFGVISITASTTLSADAYAGKTAVLNAAAGLTVTLPAATGSGATYDIDVGTTVTSNSYIIRVASASDVMAGVIILATDTDGITVPTASTSDTITMNGSTTGGLAGTSLRFRDSKSGVWVVSGSVFSTGAESTPFSAAVS